MKKLLRIIPLFIILFGDFTHGASAISIKILSGSIMPAGEDFRVLISIDPTKNNKSLYTALDCERDYFSSAKTLDEKSSAFHTIEYRNIPPGECFFTAGVIRLEEGERKEYFSTASVLVS